MESDTSSRAAARLRFATALCIVATSAVQTACGGGDDAPAPAPAPAPVALTCDDSMKTAFKPDANTSVLLVKVFKKGETIELPGGTAPGWTAPIAANDLCLVKLNVGPGVPGPVGAYSTSPGIGIEVWLPTKANWNGRLHVMGNGGWAGGKQGDINFVEPYGFVAADAAGTEGAVSSSTNLGHAGEALLPNFDHSLDASFAMSPDGTISTAAWKDFSERAVHELAVKTKALAAAYYLEAPKRAYYDSCSQGGRMGYKEAQVQPTDYDGLLIGAPAINWTKVFGTFVWGDIVAGRDLGGVLPTAAQKALVDGKAVSSCDVVGGQHLGYVLDPSTCNYDPTRDASVLCAGTTTNGVTGTNATSSCVSPAVAQAINKIWFGPTPDGSVPDPAANNGFNASLTGSQLWYGYARGTKVADWTYLLGSSMVGLTLQDPKMAGLDSFVNESGNGADGWRSLSYGGLANVLSQGASLQPWFSNIETDNADLSGVQKAGAKILHYHGVNDEAIPVQGSIQYYNRVAALDGGFANTQKYNRLYLVPAMGHCGGIGGADGSASPALTANNVPAPASNQLYTALTQWVENGTAPTQVDIQSADASASGRLCPYPSKAVYNGTGSVTSAASYACK